MHIVDGKITQLLLRHTEHLEHKTIGIEMLNILRAHKSQGKENFIKLFQAKTQKKSNKIQKSISLAVHKDGTK